MTHTPDDDWIAEPRRRHAAGQPVALLFDYDGTLTPIVSHPELALLPDGVRAVLRQLARTDRVSLGVISGRPLADVSRKVGLAGLYYAGSGGGELDLRGTRVEAPVDEHVRRQLETVRSRIQEATREFPGVWVEQKPVGFTTHYRGAVPTTAARFRDYFHALMGRFERLGYLDVCEAYEVSPLIGWDKATAVQHILARLPNDVFPVYVGDSENDRPGMTAVRNAGGQAVGVGADAPSCARHRIGSPARLHADLTALSRSLGAVAVASEFHCPQGACPGA